MCTIDYDPARVYCAGTQKARKPHECAECRRVIQVGELYKRATGNWDGHWSTFLTCQHCQVGQGWLEHNCGAFMHYGLQEEMQQHADEYPDLAAGMLRIKVGMRRKWTRFDGAGLMPLPRTPASIRSVMKEVA